MTTIMGRKEDVLTDSFSKAKFECSNCERTFRKQRALNLHIREDHGSDKGDIGVLEDPDSSNDDGKGNIQTSEELEEESSEYKEEDEGAQNPADSEGFEETEAVQDSSLQQECSEEIVDDGEQKQEDATNSEDLFENFHNKESSSETLEEEETEDISTEHKGGVSYDATITEKIVVNDAEDQSYEDETLQDKEKDCGISDGRDEISNERDETSDERDGTSDEIDEISDEIDGKEEMVKVKEPNLEIEGLDEESSSNGDNFESKESEDNFDVTASVVQKETNAERSGNDEVPIVYESLEIETTSEDNLEDSLKEEPSGLKSPRLGKVPVKEDTEDDFATKNDVSIKETAEKDVAEISEDLNEIKSGDAHGPDTDEHAAQVENSELLSGVAEERLEGDGEISGEIIEQEVEESVCTTEEEKEIIMSTTKPEIIGEGTGKI